MGFTLIHIENPVPQESANKGTELIDNVYKISKLPKRYTEYSKDQSCQNNSLKQAAPSFGHSKPSPFLTSCLVKYLSLPNICKTNFEENCNDFINCENKFHVCTCQLLVWPAAIIPIAQNEAQ